MDAPPDQPPVQAPRSNGQHRSNALGSAISLLFRSGHGANVNFSAAPPHVIRWIVPLGILVGLLWMTAFRVAWRQFGDPDTNRLRAVPALAVVAVEALITGPLLIWGLAVSVNAVHHLRHPAPALSGMWLHILPALMLLAYWSITVSIPANIGWYPASDDARSFLNPLYPQVTYRPLVLGPIWGRWAFLLAANIGRLKAGADPELRNICKSLRPSHALRWLALPLTLTLMYASREGRLGWGIVAALVVLLATFLAAVTFARRLGGHDRQSVHACCAIAQVVFLAAYRALCV